MKPKLKYLDTSNFRQASVAPKETGTKSISERYAEQRLANNRQSDRIISELDARKKSEDKTTTTPTDKRFARSSLVPLNSLEMGQDKESASSIFTQASVFTLPIENTVIGSAGAGALTRTAGEALPSLGSYLLRMTTEAVGTIVADASWMVGGAALLLLVPNQIGPEPSIYDESELRNLPNAKTNVRAGVDRYGHAWGYHVDGEEVPVVQVQRSGQKFVAHLDGEVNLEWIPIIEEDKGGMY